MVTAEHKIKYEEQVLPKFIHKLKERSYSNPDIIRFQDMITGQMEDSILNSFDTWVDIQQNLRDDNGNGILDIFEDEQMKYIFEGLPTTYPTRELIKKIEKYYLVTERQKEKITNILIAILDYADKTREVIKLIPVDSTKLGQEQVESFKTMIKGLLNAYKEEKTKQGRGVLLEDIRSHAATEEKIVWVNSVAMDVIGEEILKL